MRLHETGLKASRPTFGAAGPLGVTKEGLPEERVQ